MWLFVFFYLSLGLVRVCETEISHMNKNNGNPDLVCENFKYSKFCVWSLLCKAKLSVPSSFTIILKGKRELVTLFKFFAHQIGISVVFIHVRYFFLTYQRITDRVIPM